MTALGQGCGQGDDGVALTTEGYLERFCLIDLCHEVAALGLGHHTQRGALEGGHNLDAREIPRGSLRVGETDTASILDTRIGGTDNGSLDGEGLDGQRTMAYHHEKCDEKELFHELFLV